MEARSVEIPEKSGVRGVLPPGRWWSVGPAVLAVDVLLLMAVATWFRVAELDRVPGISSDESWYGIQAADVIAGSHFERLTPTGLWLDLFYAGPEAILIGTFGPTAWALRAPAAVSGVLAIVLGYVLGRRVMGRLAALIAAILLATLPVTIGYSRMGYEAAQSPLVGVLGLACAWRGQPIGLMAAFAASVLIHPTNVFLIPIVVPVFLVARHAPGPEGPGGRARGGLAASMAALAAMALIVLILLRAGPHLARTAGPDLARLVDLAGWGRIALLVARLFSGVLLYEHVAGPVAPAAIARHDAAAGVLILGVLAAGLWRAVQLRRWKLLALLVGIFLGLAGFYAVAGADAIVTGYYVTAGPDALIIGYERYILFLVAPMVFAVAGLAEATIPAPGSPRRGSMALALVAATSVLGWVLLADFRMNYFDPIRRSGGDASPRFRTSAVDPKREALEQILEDDRQSARVADPSRRVVILAGDWWCYWPVRYFAHAMPKVRVLYVGRRNVPEDWRREFLRSKVEAGAYVLDFAGGRVDRLVGSLFPPDRLWRREVRDSSGRPLLLIIRARR